MFNKLFKKTNTENSPHKMYLYGFLCISKLPDAMISSWGFNWNFLPLSQFPAENLRAHLLGWHFNQTLSIFPNLINLSDKISTFILIQGGPTAPLQPHAQPEFVTLSIYFIKLTLYLLSQSEESCEVSWIINTDTKIHKFSLFLKRFQLSW